MSPTSLDPEWQPYTDLYGTREAFHSTAGPCFICEGRYLVTEALRAARVGTLRILSVVTTPNLAPTFQGELPEGTRLLVADEPFLESLLGFPFHRGTLCCVQRPSAPSPEMLLDAARVVVLPRLDNVDNLGQILRTAAALGIDAVAMDRGPGPFDRRTVRVSMGAAWRVPVLQTRDLGSWLRQWKARHPCEVVGAALTETALDIGTWNPHPRTALVLGPEDQGLDADWLERCDRLVAIAMARGMDSLNVAAAGAIFMHRMVAGVG